MLSLPNSLFFISSLISEELLLPLSAGDLLYWCYHKCTRDLVHYSFSKLLDPYPEWTDTLCCIILVYCTPLYYVIWPFRPLCNTLKLTKIFIKLNFTYPYCDIQSISSSMNFPLPKCYTVWPVTINLLYVSCLKKANYPPSQIGHQVPPYFECCAMFMHFISKWLPHHVVMHEEVTSRSLSKWLSFDVDYWPDCTVGHSMSYLVIVYHSSDISLPDFPPPPKRNIRSQ